MSNIDPSDLTDFIPAGGVVKFPETAEEEGRRIGAYFLLHSIPAAPERKHDTYGDEDSSLPDWPMGVPEKLEPRD